jgi:GDPmannose 4,6-dehydratase
MAQRALITGISGQDGLYLAEWLRERGYQLHGTTRDQRAAAAKLGRLSEQVTLHACDLSRESFQTLLAEVQPQEVYHLAAPSFVADGASDPESTAEQVGLAVVRLLEAIRSVDPRIRLFQAGSSEMFGDAREVPQSEETAFRPLNPYGAAKAFAHWMVCDYRQRHGLFAVNGILFNHESPRRDPRFVTRKITAAVARIAAGRQSQLELGDLDARRDWGYSGDYVRAMQRMLSLDSPQDFVIATGTQHSVREFAEAAFACAGLDWSKYVVSTTSLGRPRDARQLCGQPAKARQVLSWQPQVPFLELVRMMVEADLRREGSG